VVRVWYDVVDYMKDPENEKEMLDILSARVGLSPAEYKPFLQGTYILTLEEVLPVWEPGDGLGTLMGSDKNVDSFNLKYDVYSESEVSPRYHDASLTRQVAKERGVTE
ncbi:MAG: ABC transporter substrate-binding protein, partial [Phycisphaeraceae bacterium]